MNKIDAKHVNFFYGDFQALKDISMTIEEKSVRLWQVHLPPSVQPHERPHSRLSSGGGDFD
jgi:ABC-type arginine transport system ATPase subunit